MTILKKKFALLLMIVLTISAVWIPVYASDDNIGYSFNLGTGYANSYSGGRYRQTTNLENKWKVNMTYNKNATRDRVTYWLARTGDKV